MRTRSYSGICTVVLLSLCSFLIVDCKKDDDSTLVQNNDGNQTYDIQAKGIPRFVSVDYIQLEKIARISKFRSGIGHDYSDDFEYCRSMKHYFQPKDTTDWTTVMIYSPVEGTIIHLINEWAGTKITICSKIQPAFFFDIFHINLASSFKEGDVLQAGQLLGHHIGSQTMSDIAVGVQVPQKGPKSTSAAGWQLISYFDVITDPVFLNYQNRGLMLRADAAISKAARDADSLQCSGDTFATEGTIENWITLH